MAVLALTATACQPGWYTTVAGSGYTTFSGDGGPAVDAQVQPAGLAVDPGGNLFIADLGNNRIRRVDAATKVITTLAGDGSATSSGDGGPATDAGLAGPASVAVGASGDLFIGEAGRVRRVDAGTGTITTIAGDGTQETTGDGGPAAAAHVGTTWAMTVGPDGNLYLTDGPRVRRLDLERGTITTVAGGGTTQASEGVAAASATLGTVRAIAFSPDGDLHLSDGHIWRVDSTTGNLVLVAGGGSAAPAEGAPARDTRAGWFPFTLLADGRLVAAFSLVYGSTITMTIDPASNAMHLHTLVDQRPSMGGDMATTQPPSIPSVHALVSGPDQSVFATEPDRSRVDRIDLGGGTATPVAGVGGRLDWNGVPAGAAEMNDNWWWIAAVTDSRGNTYMTDAFNPPVWKVDHATGRMSVAAGTSTAGFSGDGGPATSAQLGAAHMALAVDGEDNLYIYDGPNERIRRVDAATGVISTVVGNGTIDQATLGCGGPLDIGDGGPATEATLNMAFGMAVDTAGNLVIADYGHGLVRRVDQTTGIISTIAGGGCDLQTEGTTVPATSVNLHPRAVAAAPDGTVWFLGDGFLAHLDASGGLTSTYTGASGYASLAVDSTGTVYVGDTVVRRYRPDAGTWDTLAGGGASTADVGNIARRKFSNITGLYARGRDIYFFSKVNEGCCTRGPVQLLHVVDASDAPSVESLGG